VKGRRAFFACGKSHHLTWIFLLKTATYLARVDNAHVTSDRNPHGKDCDGCPFIYLSIAASHAPCHQPPSVPPSKASSGSDIVYPSRQSDPQLPRKFSL